ncbi:MAG: hypothetical protein RLZZ351_495 [Pseudomonadota bacterium]
MHDLKNQHPQQHGSTIILFALLLPIFISLAALAVDLGPINSAGTCCNATSQPCLR